MRTSTAYRRAFSIVAAILFIGFATACDDDDPTAPEEEPDVATVRLTAGAQSITIPRSGQPSGNLVIPAGTSAVTAQFLKPDGSPETLVTEAEFELRIVPTTPANLAFNRTGAFAGNLVTTGLTSGQTTTAQVSLYHRIEQHEDFGPLPFTIRIQ